MDIQPNILNSWIGKTGIYIPVPKNNHGKLAADAGIHLANLEKIFAKIGERERDVAIFLPLKPSLDQLNTIKRMIFTFQDIFFVIQANAGGLSVRHEFFDIGVENYRWSDTETLTLL